MKTILLTRPKEKEKFYDESKIKVYLNGNLVAKLRQRDTKEITVEAGVVEIVAKLPAFLLSTKANLELEEGSVLEISRTKILHNPLIVAILAPLYGFLIFQSDVPWIRVAGIVMIAVSFGWFVYQDLKHKDKAISITKV
jgi:hypothetical protein